MNILKNIENGLLRIAIVVYIIYAVLVSFYFGYFGSPNFYGIAFGLCKFMFLHDLTYLITKLKSCKSILIVFWDHMKILSIPLIFFFILSFIWKGFFKKD